MSLFGSLSNLISSITPPDTQAVTDYLGQKFNLDSQHQQQSQQLSQKIQELPKKQKSQQEPLEQQQQSFLQQRQSPKQQLNNSSVDDVSDKSSLQQQDLLQLQLNSSNSREAQQLHEQQQPQQQQSLYNQMSGLFSNRKRPSSSASSSAIALEPSSPPPFSKSKTSSTQSIFSSSTSSLTSFLGSKTLPKGFFESPLKSFNSYRGQSQQPEHLQQQPQTFQQQPQSSQQQPQSSQQQPQNPQQQQLLQRPQLQQKESLQQEQSEPNQQPAILNKEQPQKTQPQQPHHQNQPQIKQKQQTQKERVTVGNSAVDTIISTEIKKEASTNDDGDDDVVVDDDAVVDDNDDDSVSADENNGDSIKSDDDDINYDKADEDKSIASYGAKQRHNERNKNETDDNGAVDDSDRSNLIEYDIHSGNNYGNSDRHVGCECHDGRIEKNNEEGVRMKRLSRETDGIEDDEIDQIGKIKIIENPDYENRINDNKKDDENDDANEDDVYSKVDDDDNSPLTSSASLPSSPLISPSSPSQFSTVFMNDRFTQEQSPDVEQREEKQMLEQLQQQSKTPSQKFQSDNLLQQQTQQPLRIQQQPHQQSLLQQQKLQSSEALNTMIPDLSHLSDEERFHIGSVMMRSSSPLPPSTPQPPSSPALPSSPLPPSLSPVPPSPPQLSSSSKQVSSPFKTYSSSSSTSVPPPLSSSVSTTPLSPSLLPTSSSAVQQPEEAPVAQTSIPQSSSSFSSSSTAITSWVRSLSSSLSQTSSSSSASSFLSKLDPRQNKVQESLNESFSTLPKQATPQQAPIQPPQQPPQQPPIQPPQQPLQQPHIQPPQQAPFQPEEELMQEQPSLLQRLEQRPQQQQMQPPDQLHSQTPPASLQFQNFSIFSRKLQDHNLFESFLDKTKEIKDKIMDSEKNDSDNEKQKSSCVEGELEEKTPTEIILSTGKKMSSEGNLDRSIDDSSVEIEKTDSRKYGARADHKMFEGHRVTGRTDGVAGDYADDSSSYDSDNSAGIASENSDVCVDKIKKVHEAFGNDEAAGEDDNDDDGGENDNDDDDDTLIQNSTNYKEKNDIDSRKRSISREAVLNNQSPYIPGNEMTECSTQSIIEIGIGRNEKEKEKNEIDQNENGSGKSGNNCEEIENESNEIKNESNTILNGSDEIEKNAFKKKSLKELSLEKSSSVTTDSEGPDTPDTPTSPTPPTSPSPPAAIEITCSANSAPVYENSETEKITCGYLNKEKNSNDNELVKNESEKDVYDDQEFYLADTRDDVVGNGLLAYGNDFIMNYIENEDDKNTKINMRADEMYELIDDDMYKLKKNKDEGVVSNSDIAFEKKGENMLHATVVYSDVCDDVEPPDGSMTHGMIHGANNDVAEEFFVSNGERLNYDDQGRENEEQAARDDDRRNAINESVGDDTTAYNANNYYLFTEDPHEATLEVGLERCDEKDDERGDGKEGLNAINLLKQQLSYDDDCACCGKRVLAVTQDPNILNNNNDDYTSNYRNDYNNHYTNYNNNYSNNCNNYNNNLNNDTMSHGPLMLCSICGLYACASCVANNQSFSAVYSGTTPISDNEVSEATTAEPHARVVCRMCDDELKHESDTESDTESKSSDCLTIQPTKHSKNNADFKTGKETKGKMKDLKFSNDEFSENAAIRKDFSEKKEENNEFEDEFSYGKNLQNSINSQMLSSLEIDAEYFKEEESKAEKECDKAQEKNKRDELDQESALEQRLLDPLPSDKTCSNEFSFNRNYRKKENDSLMKNWYTSQESNSYFESIAAEIMFEVICDLELLTSDIKQVDFIRDEKVRLIEHSYQKDVLEERHEKRMEEVENSGLLQENKNGTENPFLQYYNDLKDDIPLINKPCSSSSSSSSSPVLDSSNESLYGDEDKEYEKAKDAIKIGERLSHNLNQEENHEYEKSVVSAVETKFDWDKCIRMSMDRQRSPTPNWCNWSTFEQVDVIEENEKFEKLIGEEDPKEVYHEESQKEQCQKAKLELMKKHSVVETPIKRDVHKSSSLDEGKSSDSAYSVDTSNDYDDDDDDDDEEDETDNEIVTTTIVKRSSIQYCPSEESEYDFDDADVEQKVTVIHYNRSDSAPCKTINKGVSKLKIDSNYNRSHSAPKPVQPTRIHASFFSDSTNSSFGFGSIENGFDVTEGKQHGNSENKLEVVTEQLETIDKTIEKGLENRNDTEKRENENFSTKTFTRQDEVISDQNNDYHKKIFSKTQKNLEKDNKKTEAFESISKSISSSEKSITESVKPDTLLQNKHQVINQNVTFSNPKATAPSTTNNFLKSFQNKFSKFAINFNPYSNSEATAKASNIQVEDNNAGTRTTTTSDITSAAQCFNVSNPESTVVSPSGKSNIEDSMADAMVDSSKPYINAHDADLNRQNATVQPKADITTYYSADHFNPINHSYINTSPASSTSFPETIKMNENKNEENISLEENMPIANEDKEVFSPYELTNSCNKKPLSRLNLQEGFNGLHSSQRELMDADVVKVNAELKVLPMPKSNLIVSPSTFKRLQDEIENENIEQINSLDEVKGRDEKEHAKEENIEYHSKLKEQLKQIEDCSNESFEEKLEAFLKLDDLDSCTEISENENKIYISALNIDEVSRSIEDETICKNNYSEIIFQKYQLQKPINDMNRDLSEKSAMKVNEVEKDCKTVDNLNKDGTYESADETRELQENSNQLDPLEVAFIGFTNELANLTREDSQTTKSSSQPDFKTVTTLLEKSESSYAASSNDTETVKTNKKLKYPLKSIKSVPAFMNPSFQLERNNSDDKDSKFKRSIIINKEQASQKMFHKSFSTSFTNKMVKNANFNWSSLKDLKVPLEDVLAELDKSLQPYVEEAEEELTAPLSAPVGLMKRCPSYSNILNHPYLSAKEEDDDLCLNHKTRTEGSLSDKKEPRIENYSAFDSTNNTFAEVAATLQETTSELETMKFNMKNAAESQGNKLQICPKNLKSNKPFEEFNEVIEIVDMQKAESRHFDSAKLINEERKELNGLKSDGKEEKLFQLKANVVKESIDYIEKEASNLPDLISRNSDDMTNNPERKKVERVIKFSSDNSSLSSENNIEKSSEKHEKAEASTDFKNKQETVFSENTLLNNTDTEENKDKNYVDKVLNTESIITEKAKDKDNNLSEMKQQKTIKTSEPEIGQQFEATDNKSKPTEFENGIKNLANSAPNFEESFVNENKNEESERMRCKSEMMRVFSMSRHRDTSPEPIYLEGLKSPCLFEPEMCDTHFFSDEDLREIDLDEDIPPKHTFKNLSKSEKNPVFNYPSYTDSESKADSMYVFSGREVHSERMELKTAPKAASKSLDLNIKRNDNIFSCKSLDEKKLSNEVIRVNKKEMTFAGISYPEAMFDKFLDFKNSLFDEAAKEKFADKSVVQHRRHSDTWKETKKKYNSLDESISSKDNILAMRASWSIRSFSLDSSAADYCLSNNHRDQQMWEISQTVEQRPSHLFGFAPKKDFNVDEADQENTPKLCEAYWSQQDEEKFIEDNKQCQLIDESFQNIQELMKIAAAKTSPIFSAVEDERDIRAEITEMAKMKILERNDSDDKIIHVFSLEIPKSFHYLHQRIKDEIKIVTATKRLRLDEAEEIRMMEAAMAERRKQRGQIGSSESLHSYGDLSIKKDRFYNGDQDVETDLFGNPYSKRISSNPNYPSNEWSKSKLSEDFQNLLNDISDLPLLSESRQSRMSSMSSISASSASTKDSNSFLCGPKKDGKDKNFNGTNKWYFSNKFEKRRGRRSESSNSCFSEGYLENEAVDYSILKQPPYETHSSQVMYPPTDTFYNHDNQEFRAHKKFHPYVQNSFPSHNSLPESRSSSMSRSINSNFSSDYDFFYNEGNNYHANYDYYNKYSPDYESAYKMEKEEQIKQEKLKKLKIEIEKRRRHLQEITPQKQVYPPPQTPPSFRELYATHNWVLQRQAQNQYWESGKEEQIEWLTDEFSASHNEASSGIIKPIDYQIKNLSNNHIQREDYILRHASRQNNMAQSNTSKSFVPLIDDNDDVIIDKYPLKSTSSNKLDKRDVAREMSHHSHQQLLDGGMKEQRETSTSSLRSNEAYLGQGKQASSNIGPPAYNRINESNSFSTPPQKKAPQVTSESEESLLKYNPPTHASSRDSGVSSSGVPGEFTDRFAHLVNKSNDAQSTPHYATTSRRRPDYVGQCRMGVASTGEKRDREVKEIGEKEEIFPPKQTTKELLSTQCKNFCGPKARSHENNLDTLSQSPYMKNKYLHKTKNILLTADANDKRFKEHGFGLIITGGKQAGLVEDESTELGEPMDKKIVVENADRLKAIVTFIMPGSIADQLNNELQEGDEIVEWNGIKLRGRSEEEVREIIDNNTFYELELVVRSYSFNRSAGEGGSTTMSTICTLDSSSGDQKNLQSTESFEKFKKRHLTNNNQNNVDEMPVYQQQQQQQLQQQQQQHHYSLPYHSKSPSSKNQVSPHFPDKQHPSISLENFTNDILALKQSTLSTDENPSSMGEIQLQLSYDDFDGTLNVHVIQARNLVPKIKIAYADPLVKVFLLPYKCSAESRRKTRCVPRTLHPEWHQTVIFMNVERALLSEHLVEVSVWDHDNFLPDQFLGELLLDLSDISHLDNRPHWYSLKEDGDSRFGRRPRTSTASSSSESGSDTSTNASSGEDENWREENKKKGRKKNRSSDNGAAGKEDKKKARREVSSNKRKSKRNQFGSNRNVSNNNQNNMNSNSQADANNAGIKMDDNNNPINNGLNNIVENNSASNINNNNNNFDDNENNQVNIINSQKQLNNHLQQQLQHHQQQQQLKQQQQQQQQQLQQQRQQQSMSIPCNYGGDCSMEDKSASMKVKDLHIHWVHNSTNCLATDPKNNINKDSQNPPFSTYVRRTVSSVWNSFACCSKYDSLERDRKKNRRCSLGTKR